MAEDSANLTGVEALARVLAESHRRLHAGEEPLAVAHDVWSDFARAVAVAHGERQARLHAGVTHWHEVNAAAKSERQAEQT